jgi:putative oxidoreductase
MTLPTSARDALLLVARVIVGVVLIAHGAQKLFSYGIDGTAASFAEMGIPASSAAAVFAAVVELVGGAALLLGAFLLLHIGNGVLVTDNGFELVAVIATGRSDRRCRPAGRRSGPVQHRLDHALADRRVQPSARSGRPDSDDDAGGHHRFDRLMTSFGLRQLGGE